MRAVIVDDEPLARDLLRRLLAAHDDIEIVGEAADGDAAVIAIARVRPDVVFLDIEMPGRDGFGVIAALAEPPAIVFVTAHDQYAVRAFDVQAVDYLRKPFDDQRLAVTLERVRRRDPETLRRALGMLAELARGKPSRLTIRDGEATHLLALDDIEAIEAAGKYVEVRLADGAVRAARETLASIEQRVDPVRFVRIHRSAIVNLDHVRVVRPWFAGDQEVTLTSGRSLTTGRGYRERLIARLKK